MNFKVRCRVQRNMGSEGEGRGGIGLGFKKERNRDLMQLNLRRPGGLAVTRDWSPDSGQLVVFIDNCTRK